MPNTDKAALELFINADGGLSCVKNDLLTAVPVGAATARTVIAIWTYGRRADATCSDQYAAQAVQALIEAMPGSSTTPLTELAGSDDPRVRPWTPTHSEPRTRSYL